jgi:hypothetical protein
VLTVIPSFADRCVVDWRAVLVPPAAGAAADAPAAEEVALAAARAELLAFLDAAERMM